MPDLKRRHARRSKHTLGRILPGVMAVVGLLLVTGATGGTGGPAPVQEMPEFTHSDHESVDCVSCHTSVEAHGSLSVTSIADCRSCHHTQPVARSCSLCHTSEDAPNEAFRVTRPVSFSVGTRDPARTMVFPHARHANIDCARCHTEGVSLAVSDDLDCAGCHAEHHTPETNCASCHRVAPVEAHPPQQAHVTCSGGGCHVDVPFRTLPRTRAFCLGCHQDHREHEAPLPCAQCHVLPDPLLQSGGPA